MMSVDSDTPSTIGSSPCCSVLFSSSWASSSFSSRAHLSRAFRAVRDRRDSLGRFRTVFGYEGSHRVGHGMVHRRRCNRNPAGYPAAVHPVDALHDPAVRARLLAPLPGIHGRRRRQRDDGCGYQGRRLDDDAGYSRDYFRVSRSVQSDYRCRCSRVLGGIVPAAGRCRFDCTRCHSAAVAQGAVTVDNVPIRLRPGNILPGRSVFYTDSR